jgi:hypothetical protein
MSNERPTREHISLRTSSSSHHSTRPAQSCAQHRRGASLAAARRLEVQDAASPAVRTSSLPLVLLAVTLALVISGDVALAASIPRVSVNLGVNCSGSVSEPAELNYALANLRNDGSCNNVTIASVPYTLSVGIFTPSMLVVSSYYAGRQCTGGEFLLKQWHVSSAAANISCAQGTVWDRAAEPRVYRAWYTLWYEDDSSSSSSGGSSSDAVGPGAIAGIVVAVAVVAVVLAAAFWWPKRQRRSADSSYAGTQLTDYAVFD